VLARLQADNAKSVRVIYRDFPLPQHDKAPLGAQAAEAAGKQGKFWEMHELIFAEQQNWASLTLEQFQSWLVDKAVSLGLDKAKFTTDMTSPEVINKIQQATLAGEAANLGGTPFLIINGKPYQGPPDMANLNAVTQLILLEKRQFTACPPMTIDTKKQYLATVKTGKGDFVIQLYAAQAPLAVNSFIFLARNGWFDGVTFHRVIPDFVAQAGDPTGTGYGGPGYGFDNEVSAGLKFDKAGVVGMANAGAGTNGSQFFITYGPTPDLDGGYTVFGQVIQGMDVVKKLTPRDPSKAGDLPPGDKINTIAIEEK
jgi:cyclophilin family peptidyl-prolyl cis-trans isomerase